MGVTTIQLSAHIESTGHPKTLIQPKHMTCMHQAGSDLCLQQHQTSLCCNLSVTDGQTYRQAERIMEICHFFVPLWGDRGQKGLHQMSHGKQHIQ